MLANVTFREDSWTYDACRVPAVDIRWQPPDDTENKYREVKDFSMIFLDWAHNLLMDGNLEDCNE